MTFKNSFEYESYSVKNASWGMYTVTAQYLAQPKDGYTVAIIDFSLWYTGKESTSIRKFEIPELVYDDGYTFKPNGVTLNGTLQDFTHTAGKSNVPTPLQETTVGIAELSDDYADSYISCEPLQSDKNNYVVCMEVPKEVETGDKPLILKMKLENEIVEYTVR